MYFERSNVRSLLVVFTEIFCKYFHFRLLPLTLIIAVFFSILQPLKLVAFPILSGCIIKFLWSSTIMKYTTSLWIGNIIIPYFTQKLNQLQNNLHQKRTTQI